ncbi:hypothetical protein ACFX13_012122 [Malus domestica]|uniref:uncharacterized protein At4g14100-like n=1 Tax=Malus domestica TaxID=3750 RepID=UPI00049887C9|nr:uncharacterized protein At4g14100-like [Malus domestica]
MASLPKPITAVPILILLAASLCRALPSSEDPVPAPWPHQFHSILVMNYTGTLQLIDLWYDWPNGRNFNIIRHQLGSVAYDLEWNNGTSFFYTLDSARECRTVQVEVGILRPDWLDGAKYLGRRHVDGGFLCNVWEKADFITYYEDVDTKRPVHWIFYTGREAHVMTFEVGAALEDAKWQAPVYCFDKKKTDTLVPEAEAEAEAEFSITGASIDWRSMRNSNLLGFNLS